MIHFFDPSDAKMAVKVPDIAKTVDIMLGNLEDAVPIDRKEAAREGLVQIGKSVDFGDTQFWTRVNSLDPRRQGRASLVRQCRGIARRHL